MLFFVIVFVVALFVAIVVAWAETSFIPTASSSSLELFNLKKLFACVIFLIRIRTFWGKISRNFWITIITWGRISRSFWGSDCFEKEYDRTFDDIFALDKKISMTSMNHLKSKPSRIAAALFSLAQMTKVNPNFSLGSYVNKFIQFLFVSLCENIQNIELISGIVCFYQLYSSDLYLITYTHRCAF